MDLSILKNIGKNNKIEKDVIIHRNVVIGDNNVIKTGTIIYPNTIIGNNNIIMENNYLGSLGVEANKDFNDLKYGGLIIGNNNTFHIKNIISSGLYGKTVIGDHNKILSDVYISHDNHIHNNVTFYPRVFSAGLVTFFNYSNVGAGAYIHQKIKVGAYSMIGMNNTIVNNVLPYMVCINGKYSRINTSKLDDNTIAQLENIKNLVTSKKYIDIKSLKNMIKCLPLSMQSNFDI